VAEIILVPLADAPASGEKPLRWSIDLWGEQYPWFSAGEWPVFYQRAANSDYRQWDPDGVEQEQIYLALESDDVVGAIALVDFDDIEEFSHLKPWVAAFIVDPDRRGTGLGSLMLTALEKKARAFGITDLYLWTEDQKNFYLKRGYHVLEHRDYPTLSIDLLHKNL
jgi:N-acetylglutamate synthase-like GNAT family acetyltransferase